MQGNAPADMHPVLKTTRWTELKQAVNRTHGQRKRIRRRGLLNLHLRQIWKEQTRTHNLPLMIKKLSSRGMEQDLRIHQTGIISARLFHRSSPHQTIAQPQLQTHALAPLL